MNFFAILQLGAQIMGEVSAVIGSLGAGQPVTLPGIRTYIAGKHVELDITIKPL